MFYEPRDRRRLVLATVLTEVALPCLWIAKAHQAGGTSVAALAPGGAIEAGTAAVQPGAPAAGPVLDDTAYLDDGPVATAPAPTGAVTIDVGAADTTDRQASGTATYHRWRAGTTTAAKPCGSALAPFGARIVVTNTDNGYKVACTNVSTKPLPSGVVLLLDTDVFLELADLGDSPVPVTISW